MQNNNKGNEHDEHLFISSIIIDQNIHQELQRPRKEKVSKNSSRCKATYYYIKLVGYKIKSQKINRTECM